MQLGWLRARRAAQSGKPRQTLEIAANAEASITGKIPHLIENRQTRQFNRQSPIAIARPVQRDAAPGVPGGDGAENTAIGIERERLGDFAPQSAEPRGGARADQRR